MKTLWAWILKTKWVVILVLGVVLTLLAWVVYALFHTPQPGGPTRLPEVPKPLQAATDRAWEQASVKKAEVKAKTDVQVQTLTTITKIPEGVERRKRLAEFLTTL